MEFSQILIILGTFGLGGFVAIVFLRDKNLISLEKAQEKADKTLRAGGQEALEIKEEAEKKASDLHQRTQEDERQHQELLDKLEESISLKENSLAKKTSKYKQSEQIIKEREEENKALAEKIKKTDEDLILKLSEKAEKDTESLNRELLDKLNKELAFEKGENLQFAEERLKENAAKIAESIVQTAIQRLSSATSVERRMINVSVPKDKLKGKIVGKGGKNIQYFEAKLGVDVIFNDQPQTISVSAFNLVNRKIAEQAIKNLFKENREINEKVIDEAIEKAKEETDQELLSLGRKGAEKINLKTDDKELLRTIGRLQYRTSYGQNIMLHSLEVGWLAVMLGAEIGLNTETLKKGGFLHDLGKAIDQDPNIQETHDVLTKEIMEKHGFSWEEIHAAWTHHDSIPLETAEAMIVKAADAISASRPGARQESMDKYVQRLKDLEGTAGSYAGVKKAFAISAGRELRVVVYPEEIKDTQLQHLADDIAKDVEENITYPGQVKVNIIRKTKAVDVAKH